MNFFDWIRARWNKETIPEEVSRAYKEHVRLKSAHDFIFEMDVSINSMLPRLSVYSLKDKKLTKYKAAHGGGGKNASPHDGWAREFSNKHGSHCTSLGTVRTGEYFISKATGASVRLYGLSPTNDQSDERGCHLHGGKYVSQFDQSICGRSEGCIVVDDLFINRVSGGKLCQDLKNGAIGVVHNGGKFS